MRRAGEYGSLVWCGIGMILACGSGPTGGPGEGPLAADMGPDRGDAGTEMESLRAEGWVWQDVEGAVCGNGQSTGMGVRPGTNARDLVIAWQGGGACWDLNTCFVLRSAAQLESGYTAVMFDNEPFVRKRPLTAGDLEGLWGGANAAFFPYCTGDLHAGRRTRNYQVLGQWREVHYQGATNVELYLASLRAQFPETERVWLVGVSAGGYGAQLDRHLVKAAFPGAEVHVMSDSAPMVQPWGGRWGQMRAAWEVAPPDGCEDCLDSLESWIDHVVEDAAPDRVGLLIFEDDQVITLYFGYPLDGSFRGAIGRVARDVYDVADNAHYFRLPGQQHVQLERLSGLKGPGDVALEDWFRWWVAGDMRWGSVPP